MLLMIGIHQEDHTVWQLTRESSFTSTTLASDFWSVWKLQKVTPSNTRHGGQTVGQTLESVQHAPGHYECEV